MREFLPAYSKCGWKAAEIATRDGFEENNNILSILWAIKNVEGIENLSQKLEYLRDHSFGVDEDKFTLSESFFHHPSLFLRSLEDFEYTTKIFNIANNEEYLGKYYYDTSKINIDQMFDSEGNIKPAGLGGPQEGFYGDTIWNTVESWSGDNGENEIERD